MKNQSLRLVSAKLDLTHPKKICRTHLKTEKRLRRPKFCLRQNV